MRLFLTGGLRTPNDLSEHQLSCTIGLVHPPWSAISEPWAIVFPLGMHYRVDGTMATTLAPL